MPIPNKQRNAISTPPASAGSESTAASTNVLAVSALAHALANSESQAADTTESQVPPGGQPGQDPPPAQAEGEPVNTNEQTVEGNAETQTQEGDGVTESRSDGENADTPTPPNADTQEGAEGDEPGVQKRIGRLQARIRELETKLASTNTTTTQTGPMPLADVMDVGELVRRQEEAESGINEVDDTLATLAVDPAPVEQFLRSNGVVLKDAQGQEDFSPARMVQFLTGLKAKFRQTLKAVPQRKNYLTAYQTNHARTLQIFPWIADVGDERQAAFAYVANMMPAIRQSPNWEYAVACALEGHLAVEARLKRNGNGVSANGSNGVRAGTPTHRNAGTAARPLPSSGGTGAARTVPRQEQARALQARQRVVKEGTRGALSAFLNTVRPG